MGFSSVAIGSGEAAALAAHAAATVTAAVFYSARRAEEPRPELTPEARERMLAAVTALHDAADRLDPAVGPPDHDTGLSSLSEAERALRAIDESTLTIGIIRARGKALALIEQADHAARTTPPGQGPWSVGRFRVNEKAEGCL